MVANYIAVLLTTMPVDVNGPVSRNIIERDISSRLMTSSGQAYLSFLHVSYSFVNGVRSMCAVYRPGEWLWIDSSGKNGN